MCRTFANQFFARRVQAALTAMLLAGVVTNASAHPGLARPEAIDVPPPVITRPDGAPVKLSAGPRLHDVSLAFAQWWERTRELPRQERIAAFKRDVATLDPGFYDYKRLPGDMSATDYDEIIGQAIDGFDAIRTDYLRKAGQFREALNDNLAAFIKVFPQFDPEKIDIRVVHSLGEMDGGTRTIDGKNVLVFGIDGMVRYHAPVSRESAFFHHELFHVMHEPLLGKCEQIWCDLIEEGMAVHVAATLHPDASEDELLLSQPPGLVRRTEAHRRQALTELKAVLDVNQNDQTVYAPLFMGGKDKDEALPVRRGYVMGRWVAAELARTTPLEQLVRLNAEQLKPLVFAAVDRLIAQSAPDRVGNAH